MSIYGYMLNENSLDGCISVFDIDTYYDQLKKGKDAQKYYISWQ